MKTGIVLLCLCALALSSYAQQTAGTESFRLMFWNLENYFDPFDDSLTSDEDYTPAEERHWTWEKFQQKRNNIYKLIMAAGIPEPPAVIGFAEVENSFVLYQLIQKTPLSRFEYAVVHKDSPDRRGIDAALIYRKDKFKLLTRRFIAITNPDDSEFRTRDIVYVKGLVGADSLHVLINHWPSRSGGQLASDSKRCLTALRLRQVIDSIQAANPLAKIVLMGDFNDTPADVSLTECLGAKGPEQFVHVRKPKRKGVILPDVFSPSDLINLSAFLPSGEGAVGTHKFQGEWAILDQVIVSGSMLGAKPGLHTELSKLVIFRPDFLLVNDEQFLGDKPFRTYNGMRYEGGYSDHLPVFIDLFSDP